MIRSFDQEVASLRRVRHPNVVSIYAQGKAPSGVPYFVMEFLNGQRLSESLTNGPLPLSRAALILSQLACALDAIHKEGICHRVVTPDNVMLISRELQN